MNVGVAHSEVNPNTRVMNSRGIWLAYVISVGVLHIVLLSIPFFSIPMVWTLTNVIHNLVSQGFSPRARAGLCWGQLRAPWFLGGTQGTQAPWGVGARKLLSLGNGTKPVPVPTAASPGPVLHLLSP